MAWQGKARQGKARQGKARQGKASHSKARQRRANRGECCTRVAAETQRSHQAANSPGAEEVAALVHGVRLNRLEHEVRHEFLAKVLDVNLRIGEEGSEPKTAKRAMPGGETAVG